MRYLFINPRTQYENTGDLLINKALIDQLSRYCKVIVDDRDKPEWFSKELKSNNSEMLSKISDRTLVATLIGRLISNRLKGDQDKYYLAFVPGDISRTGRKMAMQTLKGIALLVILRCLGCKIVRFGISVGNFDTQNQFWSSVESRFYSFLGIRDTESLAKAREFGFHNTKYFPDLAWVSNHKPIKSDLPSKNYIVLSFRSNAYGIKHDSQYFLKIANRLKAILSSSDFTHCKIVLCYQVSYDREACLELCEKLNEFEIEFIDKKLLLKESVELYSNAEFIVSNRLHVLLLGMLSDVLVFPLIIPKDNKKIVSILKDNKLDHTILNMDDSALLNLETMNEIVKRRDVELKRIQATIKLNKENTDSILTSIFLS
ncbi:polysaccharide pyruvyl transferase family protein [Dyadobacter sp. Leaf189]|uniref:polysaccharide pyruvyl transferase family protein n=1 Tax=Dyadobacter sp. Leaf189 TaxID=1736295 RepID=UPI0006F6D513|nr:polysaccharide pyruvyl transferase family protein [Dyadobacter sp. Leaf189]KQS30694.1 hypothetical protein ASG33_09895 [Dyadobacter sp. Leaf189]